MEDLLGVLISVRDILIAGNACNNIHDIIADPLQFLNIITEDLKRKSASKELIHGIHSGCYGQFNVHSRCGRTHCVGDPGNFLLTGFVIFAQYHDRETSEIIGSRSRHKCLISISAHHTDGIDTFN